MFKTTPDKGCILVIGGAKSGKSRVSLDMADGLIKKKLFLATARGLDEEMQQRIARHKKERGLDWETVEEPLRIADRICELDRADTVILVDCLTLWLNNLFMRQGKFLEPLHRSVDELIAALTGVKGVIILVSNEVGMGIVPENELARAYRDMAGSLNQRIASMARKVVAIMAGIPVVIKDE